MAKREPKSEIRYRQQHYDYDKGVLSFTAPNQVQYLDLKDVECGSGYLLIFHPDFLLAHPLASNINGYNMFGPLRKVSSGLRSAGKKMATKICRRLIIFSSCMLR